jgi:hypothetical protein
MFPLALTRHKEQRMEATDNPLGLMDFMLSGYLLQIAGIVIG